jgi:hypothetical protein
MDNSNSANVFTVFIHWLIQYDQSEYESHARITSKLTIPWPRLACVCTKIHKLINFCRPKYTWYSNWNRQDAFIRAWKRTLLTIFMPTNGMESKQGTLFSVTSFPHLVPSKEIYDKTFECDIIYEFGGTCSLYWREEDEEDIWEAWNDYYSPWGSYLLFGYISDRYIIKEIEKCGTWTIKLQRKPDVDNTGYDFSEMDEHCLTLAEDWLLNNLIFIF